MHTATQLDRSMFAIELDGRSATREQLFAGWGAHDRLGVVAHDPFGALGASLLIQLAITAFYDERPMRRSTETPQYPEFFLFHVGGYGGNYRFFDFWPPRKEVELPDDPHAVLAAINDRAITRLVVVDGEPREIEHEWKEPASAVDRITTVLAYDPGGRTKDADVVIRGLDRRVIANTTMTLHPERWPKRPLSNQQQGDDWRVPDRLQVILDEHAPRVIAERDGLLEEDGLPCESYRLIDVADALCLLHAHRPAAPS
jgi:hypothetical protein